VLLLCVNIILMAQHNFSAVHFLFVRVDYARAADETHVLVFVKAFPLRRTKHYFISFFERDISKLNKLRTETYFK
jgi:hypothetical protein